MVSVVFNRLNFRVARNVGAEVLNLYGLFVRCSM